MILQILAIIFISIVGWSLLAADYIVKAPQRGRGPFTKFQTPRSVEVHTLGENEVDSLRARGYVVEPNASVYMLRPHQVYVAPMPFAASQVDPAQWPGEVMNLPQAHALQNSRGEGQTVCVVDTGIDQNHPMFAGAEVETYNALDNSLDANDGQGHGTFMASLIAGRAHPSAPAPMARILAVKSLDDRGAGSLASVIRGIDYCASRSSVINLSLGTQVDSALLRESIQAATNLGVTVVAAVGNDASGKVGYPASYPEVLAVSSVNSNLQSPPYTSFGLEIDFTAPGANVWGALPNNQYGVLSGNSLATAFVSGVAILQKSRASRGLVGRDIGLPPEYQGAGLIDAYATATYISE